MSSQWGFDFHLSGAECVGVVACAHVCSTMQYCNTDVLDTQCLQTACQPSAKHSTHSVVAVTRAMHCIWELIVTRLVLLCGDLYHPTNFTN